MGTPSFDVKILVEKARIIAYVGIYGNYRWVPSVPNTVT